MASIQPVNPTQPSGVENPGLTYPVPNDLQRGAHVGVAGPGSVIPTSTVPAAGSEAITVATGKQINLNYILPPSYTDTYANEPSGPPPLERFLIKRDKASPAICSAPMIFCCSLCYNLKKETYKIKILDENKNLIFKLEILKYFMVACLCLGKFEVSFTAKDDQGNKVCKFSNKGSSLLASSGNNKQILPIKDKNGDTIGRIGRLKVDPKTRTVGHGKNRRTVTTYDHIYKIYNTDNDVLYEIRGEERFFELKLSPEPGKKFWIYKISGYVGQKKTVAGRLDIYTEPYGCYNDMGPSLDEYHKLTFPPGCSLDDKVLISMMAVMVEMEFTDRQTLCGC